MLQQQAPEWTNHNPSDPGITVIELLAYFTEILIFRLDQITIENRLDYLRLLRGPAWNPGVVGDRQTLEALTGETLRELRKPQRAVTAEDYEDLALQVLEVHPGAAKGARAFCSVGRNLCEPSGFEAAAERPGHVSVSILPHRELQPSELERLTGLVEDELRPKCLITTRLHVVGPCVLRLSFAAEIHLRAGGESSSVVREVSATLSRFLNPYDGCGPGREGWPFGRSVYLSELIELMESVAGVDYVENPRIVQASFQQSRLRDGEARIGLRVGGARVGTDTRLGTEREIGPARLIKTDSGRMAGVALRPHEVVQMVADDVQLAFV